MLTKLIKHELANPRQHQPITRGWFVALLLAGVCVVSVPFYLLYKLVKR